MKKHEPEVQWFARGGGIKRCGPFASFVEAAAALRTTKGEPVDGAFCWPEQVVRRPQVRSKASASGKAAR